VDTFVHIVGGHCGCRPSDFWTTAHGPQLMNGRCNCAPEFLPAEQMSLRAAIDLEYAPTRISFRDDTWCDQIGASCDKLGVQRSRAVLPRCLSCNRALKQFVGIADCYRTVEQKEAATQQLYMWIVRIRPDMVFFSNLDLRTRALEFVYIPGGGMTEQPRMICHSDHAFFCPRRLCRPYFTFLELWESPYSDASNRSQLSVYARHSPAGWALSHLTEPSELFQRPTEPQWWHRYAEVTSVYNERHGPQSLPLMIPPTCGASIVRLLHLAYALARGNATHAGVLTQERLDRERTGVCVRVVQNRS
jgi:hypothetical protein